MNTIITKWVCINRSDVNKDLLTEGKVYEITKDISICPVTNIDLSHTYFIADNGRSFRIDLKNDFTPLEEYRQEQLNKII